MKVFILLILGSLALSQNYTLDECVAIALQNKVTVQSAELDIQSAQAGQKASLSPLLPRATLQSGRQDGKTSVGGVSGSSTDWSAGIAVSATLYDGGNTWRQAKIDKYNVTAAEIAHYETILRVKSKVYNAYYSLLKAQHLLLSAQEDLDLAREQLDLANLQFDLGAVKKTDALKTEVKYGQARAAFLSRQIAVDNAKRELANAMGMVQSLAEFNVVDIQRDPVDVPDFPTALAIMKEQNPSIKREAILVITRELNYQVAGGARLPSLSASGSYTTRADKVGGLLQDYNKNWNWSVGLSLSYPLFTGYTLSSRVQQTKYAWLISRNNYINLVDNLTVQLKTVINDLNNYRDIIPILEDILAAAEEDLKLANKRYSLGAAIILEVLDAQVSVTQARTKLINTRYDALIQEVALKTLLGTL